MDEAGLNGRRFMPQERSDKLTRAHVPDAHRAIDRRGDNASAGVVEGKRLDALGVTAKGGEDGPRLDVDDLHHQAADDCEQPTVG